MVTDATKQVIPFGIKDAGRVGEGCFYLDVIVWLNGDRIQLGDRVSFGYGCYVNGYGGLVIGDDCGFGPYVMIHTANHRSEHVTVPIRDQAGSRVLSRSGPTASSAWAVPSFRASA